MTGAHRAHPPTRNLALQPLHDRDETHPPNHPHARSQRDGEAVHHACPRAARDEFDVHVCVLTRGGPLLAQLEEAGISTTLLEKRRKLDPSALMRLRRLIRALKPDLVQTWLFAANAYGRAAAASCRVPRILANERCVDTWKSWPQLAVDRLLVRYTTRIVVNSPAVQQFYVEHGLPEAKFEVIPNGIAPLPPSSATREEIRAEFGLAPDSRLIAMVGRLWPQKRVKDAIWAADTLSVIRGGVHLLVIGDGPERTRLERFRDQSKIVGAVHFLGHRSDVSRLLPHVDVFWNSSAYEGQSNAIMEAMAAGVPVVATDIPGTRDLVVHGTTGFLVPPANRSPHATCVNRDTGTGLAKHTQEIFNDPALGRRMGEAGRQRILEHFSVETMTVRYADLYRRLLG